MKTEPRGVALLGHRGARGLWPENTLAGFARAIELGVSGIELDCAVTRDGVVVVTHDPELNPDCTRDERGHFLAAPGPPIAALTYAEVARYDVGRLRPGSAYAERFPLQEAVDGERIPRLADALALIMKRGRGEVLINVEVKTFPEQPQLTPALETFVAALCTVLEKAGAGADFVISSFDWRVLGAAHRLLPGIATGALTEEQSPDDTVRLGSSRPSPWLGGLDPERFGGSVPRLAQATGAAIWGPDYLDLTAQRISEAHALGLRVVPWTVNAPKDMARLLRFEVDGIITDRPDLLRAELTSGGFAVPPRRPEAGGALHHG
ncbi:MAG: glycerophosphodiester phosphodiesterase [Gammaproteobacteria bacterium]|nr:glycerophosphodiester phosphodiesterase [Gammaproteobacteria bacterium]